MSISYKTCSKCGEYKPISNFYFRRDRNKHRNECIACKALYDKNYAQINKHNLKKKRKQYYETNKEAVKVYYEKHKKEIREKRRIHYKSIADKERIRCRKYYRENKEEIIKQKTIYHKNRLSYDIEYRLLNNLRSRIRAAIKNCSGKKAYKSINLLGCTIKECRNHLESQFAEGMTWDNYGEWHLDHIRPCASYDLTDPEQQKQCFHYTNLQPLWAEDNFKKSNKY